MNFENKNKRGLLLLKQIIELIIAVLAIVLIIYAGTVLFRSYFGNQREMQAKGTLEGITKILDTIKISETKSYELFAPSGWYLVSFDASHNLNKKFQKPSFQDNLLCVCRKKCTSELCLSIKKPLKQKDQLINMKIEILDLWITNKQDYYEISKINPTIEAKKLSEKEKANALLAYKRMQESEWSNKIPEISQKYYDQNKLNNYVANKEDFEKIVRAIIIQESQSVEDAIGCDGEVGLMQIMPETAIALGFNVPDYGTEDISQISPCISEKRTDVSKCNKVHPENCKKDDNERFDPIKNIDAGTRYLAEQIANLGDLWLGVMAYNAGAGGVSKNCVSENEIVSIACPPTFAGRQYAEEVKAKMKTIA